MVGFHSWSGNQDPASCHMAWPKKKKKKKPKTAKWVFFPPVLTVLSIAITGSADAEYLLEARPFSAAAAVSEQTDKIHACELGTRAPCGKNKARSGCIGKIPWRRAWQPTPLFLPGESPWTEEVAGLQSMGSQSPT